MEQSEEYGLVTRTRWNIAKGLFYPYFNKLFFFFGGGEQREGCHVEFCHKKVICND